LYDEWDGQPAVPMASLVTTWKRWFVSFAQFADSKGLIINADNDNDKQRRRAMLLHHAGTDVEDIFLTLFQKEVSQQTTRKQWIHLMLTLYQS